MARLLTITQITRAATSFAVVVVAYWAYSLLAVPWIEPVAAERAAVPGESQRNPMSAVTRHTALLEALYPDENVWQRKRPKIVETQQVVLLLNDYRTLEDGRMEIKPCTLLFVDESKTPRADGHPGRVMVLDAPEGAILQFDNDLDLRKAEFGRLVGGRLVGQVTIRSNESEPGADDRIYLGTQNVNMDQKRLWTPNEVEFRFGKSYGRGRDLILTFLPADESLGKQRGPNIGGIKSLELVHLDRLHLVSQKSLFDAETDKSQREPRLPPGAKHGVAPVEISCQGPFIFDLENSVATFEEQVDVLRLNQNGPSDQLNCRLLEIHFDPLLAEDKQPRDAKETKTSQLRKVVALGYPVVLNSPSLAASARGERLEFDVAKRQFRLDGEQPVMLQHEDRRIEALAVKYQMPEDGRIGRAWAQGPGRFRAALPQADPQEPARVLTAQWQDELRLQPDGNSHVLSLSGDAHVGDEQFGGLAASEIHLWLKEIAATGVNDAKPPAPDIQPDRLLAESDVHLDSPALTGKTDRFEVWFQQVPPEMMAQNPAPHDDLRQPLPRRPALNDGPASQFDVTGKALRVLLATAGKKVQLRDVSVEGNARIVETKTATPGDLPVEISGDFVHVSAADSPQAKAVVAGKPALVSGRGVTLRGASVHLDRAANRIWVPGQGQATLPMAAASRTDLPVRPSHQPHTVGRADLEVRPTNQTANVTWQDGMQFDGRTVQLRGNVLAKTDQQKLTAPMVDISLSQRVSFTAPPKNNAIDVKEIRLRGQVTMENRTIENGQLASVDEMMVRDLTIDQQTGALSADGPGWIKSVRRGGSIGPNQFAGPAFGNANIAPADAAPKTDDNQLSYLRVTFQTALTGNVRQRHLQLHEGVRAVYGPIGDWQETIDPDRALETSGDVVLLTSDTLQVAEMGSATPVNGQPPSPGGLGPVELQALGNAMVEGQTFTARAHRIAYTQAKDLLVMEGDGRTDAELYRQSAVGGQTGRASARKILYFPSTGRMDVDTFTSLDWASPPVKPGAGNPLPSGVGDYLRRERESRPSRSSTAPR